MSHERLDERLDKCHPKTLVHAKFTQLNMFSFDFELVTFYALVICNKAPHPRGRMVDSCGNERGFDQSFATTVRGKCMGFALYRQKGS